MPVAVPVWGADSPGAGHRAEGMPRKGGRRWAPRVMWGAAWGGSRGGGWDSSLQDREHTHMSLWTHTHTHTHHNPPQSPEPGGPRPHRKSGDDTSCI